MYRLPDYQLENALYFFRSRIEDNHTIAQECETSAFLSAKVQGKDAQEANDAA